MKFKQFLAGLLAVGMILTSAVAAFADGVNIDNILHQSEGAVGRYKYSGSDWGWIVEVYVATTEDGKLNEAKTLIDKTNATYLGRVAFTTTAIKAPFPAMQRPVAIHNNGGGMMPKLTDTIYRVDNAHSFGFPDPMTTGADTLKSLFEVGQPALNNTWVELEKQYGGSLGLLNKIGAVVSQYVKDKVKSTGDPGCLKPSNDLGIECPVEYAFVLTPIEYLKIEPGTSSSLNWNTQFWMGANEGAVLNRASLVTAKKRLEQFDKAMENSPLKGSAIYKEARAILVAATLKGEMYWVQNLTHRDLPDSAFLDHNQFGITTP